MSNTSIQQQLIRLGLLDPPADGLWGKQTELALSSFCSLSNLKRTSDNSVIESALAIAKNPVKLGGSDFASRIVTYMRSQSQFIAVSTPDARRLNIVYIEGRDPDGSLNSDAPNCFNDASVVVEVVSGTPKIVFAAVGTTEPGRTYTESPLNPGGAFRIAFGQFKAWQVGIHYGSGANPHEALVQVGEISGYRDYNRDYKRTGDRLVTGSNFQVNQHSGFDFPTNNIGGASAGCLLRRKWDDHYEFMKMVKRDVRYGCDKKYTFMTTIIPGDKL